jgi:hypothetical protein
MIASIIKRRSIEGGNVVPDAAIDKAVMPPIVATVMGRVIIKKNEVPISIANP